MPPGSRPFMAVIEQRSGVNALAPGGVNAALPINTAYETASSIFGQIFTNIKKQTSNAKLLPSRIACKTEAAPINTLHGV